MATGTTTVSSAVGRGSSLSHIKVSVLKEGNLLKRQRGRSSGADLRRLKWQQRYISLTPDYLYYYSDQKKKKGEFPVNRMRIVEKVPDSTFHASNCMQIGDEEDVMYFKAKTENERKQWMEAFTIAVTIKKNTMLDAYHIGAYGQVYLHMWSCCNAATRSAPGCQKTKTARRMTTLIEDHDHGDSESNIELVDRRYSVATCPSPDTQSIDSGYLESVNKFGGSQLSVNLRQNDSWMSSSPSMQSKPVQEASIEQEQLKEAEQDYRLDVQRAKQTWLLVQDSESEVTSVIFRGTDTLLVSHKDGSVQIIGIRDVDVKGAKFEYVTREDPIGSVDMWKNFLAVGCLNVNLWNLNTIEASKKLQNDNEGEMRSHPYLVAFTPRGHLLSYNQSQPAIIKMWPIMESLWLLSNAKCEGCLDLKDATSTLNSLLVSPNPNQPWIAVATTNTKQLQVYDYHKWSFKSQFEFADEEKMVVSFSPDGKSIVVGRGRNLTFYDIESSASLCHFSDFDVKITSLAYNLWSRDNNLAIGLENGQIMVYNALSNSPTLLVSLDSQEPSKAITCMAYSKDGQTLAAGSSGGKVKLWRKVLSTSVNTHGVVLVRERELKVDCKGKQYVSPDDGYAISIPPGAIPEGTTVTLKHGIVPDGPFGPFKFPKGVRPVSAILSLQSTAQDVLLKPIDIALPHFICCETLDDCRRLAVFKAKCSSYTKKEKQVFNFEKVTNADINLSLGTYYGDPKYPEGVQYAKFSTTHHCYMCIGEYGREDTDRAIFSLVEVKPKVMDRSDNYVVHFCLPYFLPTCHKTVRDQYPDKEYNVSIQSIKFCSDASCDEPAIGINFRERIGDWLFSLQGGNDKKIYLEDVCFWDYPTPLYLKEMCEEKLYPPRFSIHIRGVARQDDVIRAEFTFPGAVAFPGRGEPVAVIHLPLPVQRSSLSTESVSRVNSDCSMTNETSLKFLAHHPQLSSQQSLQPAAQAFKTYMCDLDDLHPSRLAMNLFSKDLIDEAEFKSIQDSMKLTTKDEIVLCNEILFKIYDALKVDVKVYNPLHEVLMKLKPEIAEKLASEMNRLSREASVASTSSPSAAHTKLSNQIPNGSTTTLKPHSPIHFHENFMEMLQFHSQAPDDPNIIDIGSASLPESEPQDVIDYF